MNFAADLRRFIGLAVALALILTLACNKDTPQEREIKDLTIKAMELDDLQQKSRLTGAEQSVKLREAGVDNMRLDSETMELTPEQKSFLEARVKAEKDNTPKALIQEVLDKDKEIKDLNARISSLRAVLPRPDTAKENDNHYGLAMKFLRNKKVNEETARRLVSRVLIMDRLAPGFEVYHFYSNGVYGTWVAQGSAAQSPTEMQAEERQQIETERDAATSRAEQLQEELTDLIAQKAVIQSEIEAMYSEKANLIEEMSALAQTNETQRTKLNSLHYLVGGRKALEKEGIIVVPVFAKDRAGKNWRDEIFNRSLDLRSSDGITINANEVGLNSIGKLNVIPGSYIKGEHFSVTIT
ncbi:MAG: hypothetical protein LBQ86_00850, partial [Holophagales bacterium]|nr:hypothetical protein [Holophagales bacterium]